MSRLLPSLALTISTFLYCLAAGNERPVFYLGADISGTTELESRGTILYNAAGEPRENTILMKELGMNAIRLRIWVNPRDGFCSPEDMVLMARRARDLNMPVMIDFHYSDWWADPGKQNIPQQWKNMDYPQMCRAVADHTRHTLQLMRDNQIDVRWVQVGNETTNGFLWPMGQADINMQQYAGLTKAGCEAAKEIFPNADIIIHLDAGCDPKRYDFIFDGLKQYGVTWDIIGMSIYPYWDIDAKLETDYHGTINDFTANVRRLAEKYGTELMIVETGVEVSKPNIGKQILSEIIDAAINRCDGHCHGVFYWAPELEGQYPLGAFNNHRPTVIMEAFTEAAQKLAAGAANTLPKAP